jgi:hypothetical protein
LIFSIAGEKSRILILRLRAFSFPKNRQVFFVVTKQDARRCAVWRASSSCVSVEVLAGTPCEARTGVRALFFALKGRWSLSELAKNKGKYNRNTKMPAGIDVRPKIWSDVIDLYDDGEYSAIWGSYNGNKQRSLGVRWNEGENPEIGYPSISGEPQWYVEPRFITQSVLSALLNKVLERSLSFVNFVGSKENIIKAQEEFAHQLVGNRLKRVIALYGAQTKGKTPTLNRLIALLASMQGRELIAPEPTSGDMTDLLKDKKACFK